MAKFNPDVQQVQEPNYLNQSKGVDAPRPNKSFETLFEGLGNVGDGLVRTIDSSNKADIQNQVVAGVDAIRGATGVDVATDRAAQGNTLVPNQAGSPVPSAISKASSDVARLKDAYDQGKINDSYYWGRVNALAKQIRTQYPGYREEIDSSFSSVTGANPANALRKAIQSDFDAAQGKLEQAGNKEDAFVNQNLPEISETIPDYWQRRAAGNPVPFDEVRARVAQKQTQNAALKEQGTRMDLLSKQGALDAETAQSNATLNANTIVNNSVAAGVQALGSKIQEAIKGGKPIPPEQIAEFQAAYGQLRAKAEVSINQFLNNPYGDDKTKTPASIIKDSGKLKSIKDNALANLDSMKELLTNGQYGVFQMNASIAKASTDYTTSQILQRSEAARKISAANAISSVALNSLTLARPQILDEFSEAINNVHIAESVTGEGSITKQLDNLKNPSSNKLGRGAASRLIDDKVNFIGSKDAPDNAKVNVAKSLFSDQESGFLEKFAGSDRLRVFQKLTAPEVTKEMQRLRTADPNTYENYRKWATNSFSTLLKTQANTIQDINAYNEDVKLTFDPAAMQYQISIADAKPNANLPVTGQVIAGTVNVLANKLRLNEAQQALAPINAALKNLAPIINEGNKDPEALAKVLTGIDPQGPKQTGLLQWLGNGIVNAVSGAAGAVGNAIAPPAKGATREPSLKGISLDAYTPEDAKGAILDSAFNTADLSGIKLDGGEVDAAVQQTGVKGLLDKIGQGEAGGSYNVVYGGRKLPLTEMTLGEVMSLQNQMSRKGSPSTAVGKYQFINSTLGNIARKMGVGPDTPFTPELQDKLAVGLLKGRGLDQYLSGKLSKAAFIDNIAQEWAAVKNTKGKGHYDGDGLNKGSLNISDLVDSLKS